MTRKKKPIKTKSSFLPLFLIFIFIALITVLLLEYLDFKKGKKSFFFKKVIHLENTFEKSEQFTKNFVQFLNRARVKYDYFRDEKKEYHFKLDVTQAELKSLVPKIKNFISRTDFNLKHSEVQNFKDKIIHLYTLRLRKKNTHALLITASRAVPQKIDKPKVRDSTPKIAFIIDDIGNREGVTLALKELNIPITASILPDTPYAVEEANEVKKYGLEAMIHLPMQPKNSNHYHKNRLKVIGLDSNVQEADQIIKRAMQIIPNAKGINNHEGSLITSKREIMTNILQLIKKKRLFFIDSRTSSDTVAYDIAKKLKIKTGFRDVFLDSSPSYTHSMEQIKRLIKIAKQKGKAIAIGHPFESTIKAIRDSIEIVRRSRIKIVFVSRIVE